MNDELAATIARQEAEQAAREAIPGRYDGVLVKDIAAAVARAHEDLASLRQANGQSESRGDVLDLELRELAVSNPQATSVYHHRCVLAQPVAPLSPDGRPLTEPTMDLRQLLDWWSPGGKFETNWRGVVCQPGTFYALQFSDEGQRWYDSIRVIHPPSRGEKVERILDQVTADGVPSPGVDAWDEEERDPRPVHRATISAPLRLAEVLPSAAPRRSVETFFGAIRGRSAQEAFARARPQPPRLAEWLTWVWPADVTLPLGKLRSGVRAVPALPGDGATVEIDRTTWRASWPGMMSPPPDWLVSELQRLSNG